MKRVLACCLTLLFATLDTDLWSAPTADELLPSTTQAMVTVPSVDDLRQRWSQTQLGQLVADPVMKPFAEDLQKQIQERLVKGRLHLSLSWDEIAAACGGELTMAAIQPERDPKQHAVVLILDVTGRHEAAQRLLDESTKQLAAQKAERKVGRRGEHEWVMQTLPRRKGETNSINIIRFMAFDRLVISDHEGIAMQILDRLASGNTAETLGTVADYQTIMQRIKTEAGEMTPQIRWYVEPFGYAEVMRASQRGPKKRRKDMLAILKAQGFDAVKGAGGWVHLSTGDHEALHRTFVYAPGAPDQAERFKLAARMLDFPNSSEWVWPAWVPRDLAATTRLHLNAKDAFEHSKTLVDSIAGDEGFFEAFLSSMRDDLNGPRIDVRKDFVAHLGQEITTISDYVEPITPQSERLLVAITVKDEEAVRRTIEKTLEKDPQAKRLEVAGFTVWEIISAKDEGEDAPNLDLDIQIDDPLAPEPEAEGDPTLPNSAVTVANGHFIVSTHVDFLQRILSQRPSDDQLNNAEDFQLVMNHLTRLGAGNDSLRYFSRTDEAYHPTYELVRTGRMPEAESLLGRMLNRLLGDEKSGQRKQTIDGAQLPEFDTVRRYLGPSGGFSRTEKDGWYVSGVLLNKQAKYTDGTDTSAVTASRPGDTRSE